ncbi:protein AGENET DOMAIN (AGD)-CONTAINING P1-like [Argentina anserina]|uniref:protein AGENET DOMAIN (AGD)-CONTAINING P1-like n=1 Tax=Argentina anserina TaxID=57926 RepID=UPI0021768FB4|nr:protein AGENET DOMAIN (AGD)-CONTAINING P1-like [Potentilla anserina]
MAFQSKSTFHVGDAVEVCCNEEGFLGSYWEATIVATCNYEYKRFVEEHDESTPLRETVNVTQVRPLPPNIVPSKYCKLEGDRVDAFLNDVWWVGTISRKLDSEHYVVFFENTGEQNAFPLSNLRFHMDWLNGDWVPSKKRRASVFSKKEVCTVRTIFF